MRGYSVRKCKIYKLWLYLKQPEDAEIQKNSNNEITLKRIALKFEHRWVNVIYGSDGEILNDRNV